MKGWIGTLPPAANVLTISSNRSSTARSQESYDSDARQWIAVVETLV